jgi:hypothetical protein
VDSWREAEFDSKERRSGQDRRAAALHPLTPSALRWKRRGRLRRKDDASVHLYLDRYPAQIVVMLVVLLLLSLTDAYITLYLLGRGGRELNPVMDLLLQQGAGTFLIVKYVLTGVGALWLVVHQNYRFMGGRITGKHLLGLMIFLYSLLMYWEAYLVSKVS